MASRTVVCLDGESSYVQAGNEVAVGNGNFTYEIWFKPFRRGDVQQGLMGSGRGDRTDRRGINLRYLPGGMLQFNAANHADAITLRYEGGMYDQWLHAAAIVDRQGKATLMLNGVVVGETYATGFGDDGGFDAGPFRIGRRPYTDIWHFHGMIAEVRVWNIARDPEQVQKDMYQRLSGKEQGLIGYWTFSEGEGSVTRDETTHQNHARLHGTSWERESGRYDGV